MTKTSEDQLVNSLCYIYIGQKIESLGLLKQDLIIDVSNVAYDGVSKPRGEKPRYSNIVSCLDYFKNKKAKAIADSNLQGAIEQTKLFKEAVDSKTITVAPTNKADDLIIAYATTAEFLDAKMVINDRFLDYLYRAGCRGDSELVNLVFAKPQRFMKFRIADGKFIPL